MNSSGAAVKRINPLKLCGTTIYWMAIMERRTPKRLLVEKSKFDAVLRNLLKPTEKPRKIGPPRKKGSKPKDE